MHLYIPGPTPSLPCVHSKIQHATGRTPTAVGWPSPPSPHVDLQPAPASAQAPVTGPAAGCVYTTGWGHYCCLPWSLDDGLGVGADPSAPAAAVDVQQHSPKTTQLSMLCKPRPDPVSHHTALCRAGATTPARGAQHHKVAHWIPCAPTCSRRSILTKFSP